MPRTKKLESEETGLEKNKVKTPRKKVNEDNLASKEQIYSESKEEKLAKLKEKAKKLESSIKSEEIDIRKKVKAEDEEKKDMLVPIEDYLKSSIHLGTRAITPDMRPYVYKRRADSLAVFNTALLDENIRKSADYLAQFAPSEVVLVCKREAGVKAAEIFSRITGIKTFTKKYPAGILTNPNLDNFLEANLIFICDPWTDKSALEDARRIKIPVMAICDTNNYTRGVTKIIPGNNKSAKSLGIIFYLLTRLYVEKRKINTLVPPIQEFIEGWDSLVPPK